MAKVKLKASNGDKPTKRADISKMYMVEYTKLFGTDKQKKEFKKIIQDNVVTKTSPLTKEPYQDINLKIVREKFCEMFFPELTEAGQKKKKKAKKSDDFFSLVDEL